MPNALKNVVESGANTLSDLVDDARSLIEDLPPLANARKKRHRRTSWSSVFVLVGLALVAMVVAKQLRSHSTENSADRPK